jgi:hypothetical protein
VITQHVIRPNAAEDFDEQLDYYETEAGLELALRFFSAVEKPFCFFIAIPMRALRRSLQILD